MKNSIKKPSGGLISLSFILFALFATISIIGHLKAVKYNLTITTFDKNKSNKIYNILSEYNPTLEEKVDFEVVNPKGFSVGLKQNVVDDNIIIKTITSDLKKNKIKYKIYKLGDKDILIMLSKVFKTKNQALKYKKDIFNKISIEFDVYPAGKIKVKKLFEINVFNIRQDRYKKVIKYLKENGVKYNIN